MDSYTTTRSVSTCTKISWPCSGLDGTFHQNESNNPLQQAILGSAALFGMTADLQLSLVDDTTTPPTVNTSRLSWATSIFYFGQLVGSYPMTYALQRFNVRYILGPAVMVWAVICASTAGVTSWRGLLAQRFFLGTFQSYFSYTQTDFLQGSPNQSSLRPS